MCVENRKNPKVTIMIPTFNQESYISDAIESAMAQDYKNLEIVVSDDCSLDRTGEVAAKYLADSRVKYYRNEQNLGRVGNYHKTLYDYATGDWAVNLDGDDYYTDPHFISRYMKVVLSEKRPIILCLSSGHAYRHVKKRISYQPTEENGIVCSGKDYFLAVSKIGGFNHYTSLYNRQKAKEIDFYTFDSLTSDFHSIIRLVLLGDVIFFPQSVATWREHANNATFIEVKNRMDKNKQAFEDIANFSSPYIGKEKSQKWLKIANKKAELEAQNIAFFNAPTIRVCFKLFIKAGFKFFYFIVYIKSIKRRCYL